MQHAPPEVTSRETFLENLNYHVKEAHESGGFTAVLELAQQHQATLAREFATLTAGHELRRMSNQEREELRRQWTPEKARLNQQIEDLRWKRSQWNYVAGHSREFAANEALGWTIMPDGTPAKALDNDRVISSYGGVRYEEDDGAIVDTSKRGEQWQRRHQRHVRKFGQRVRDERLQKVRSRARLSPQRRARHEHRPGRARRAASSSTSSSADPGSGTAPWRRGRCRCCRAAQAPR